MRTVSGPRHDAPPLAVSPPAAAQSFTSVRELRFSLAMRTAVIAPSCGCGSGCGCGSLSPSTSTTATDVDVEGAGARCAAASCVPVPRSGVCAFAAATAPPEAAAPPLPFKWGCAPRRQQGTAQLMRATQGRNIGARYRDPTAFSNSKVTYTATARSRMRPHEAPSRGARFHTSCSHEGAGERGERGQWAWRAGGEPVRPLSHTIRHVKNRDRTHVEAWDVGKQALQRHVQGDHTANPRVLDPRVQRHALPRLVAAVHAVEALRCHEHGHGSGASLRVTRAIALFPLKCPEHDKHECDSTEEGSPHHKCAHERRLRVPRWAQHHVRFGGL